MPELPEVQTTVNGLQEYVIGATIVDVWTDYASFKRGKGGKGSGGGNGGKKSSKMRPDFESTIKSGSFLQKIFLPNTKGAQIVAAERRAKNILIHLSNGHTILIHLKMTGHLLHGKYNYQNTAWKPAVMSGPLADPFNRFIRLIFTLNSGGRDNKNKNLNNNSEQTTHLALSDTRRFAKVTILKTADLHKSHHLNGIGPEPLEDGFTFTKFSEVILGTMRDKKGKKIDRNSNKPIKPTLMDQTVVAGIGNIYADESLWRAGIDPRSKVGRITVTKLRELYNAIRTTLRKGIDFGGDSMSDYRNILGERGRFQEQHRAYRRTSKPCGKIFGENSSKKTCPGIIKRIVLAGRSTHYCPKHQIRYC